MRLPYNTLVLHVSLLLLQTHISIALPAPQISPVAFNTNTNTLSLNPPISSTKPNTGVVTVTQCISPVTISTPTTTTSSTPRPSISTLGSTTSKLPSSASKTSAYPTNTFTPEPSDAPQLICLQDYAGCLAAHGDLNHQSCEIEALMCLDNITTNANTTTKRRRSRR